MTRKLPASERGVHIQIQQPNKLYVRAKCSRHIFKHMQSDRDLRQQLLAIMHRVNHRCWRGAQIDRPVAWTGGSRSGASSTVLCTARRLACTPSPVARPLYVRSHCRNRAFLRMMAVNISRCTHLHSSVKATIQNVLLDMIVAIPR